MTVRYYDTDQKKWGTTTPNVYSKTLQKWVPTPGVPNPNLYPGGMSDPYIGEGTIWQIDAQAQPLDPNSDAMTEWFVKHRTYGSFYGGNGGMGFNTSLFGTPPIPVFVIDSSLPGMTYQTIDSVARVDDNYANTYLLGKIPWPTGASPVTYQDQSMAIWDRATGIMREYFYMGETSPGHWAASSAGVSIAKPYFEDMGSYNYGTQLISGTSAVVGMHNELGFLEISGLLNTTFDADGKIIDCPIEHTLSFTSSSFSNAGPSWPATDMDGQMPGDNIPREGQLARLKSTVDPHYNPKTGKPYNKMTQVLIVVTKKHGMRATDRNDAIDAWNGESGEWWKILHGQDPWERKSDKDQSLNGLLVQKYFDKPDISMDITDYPMDQVEWCPVDMGRPQVDFFPRYRQTGIYVDPSIQ